MLFTRREEWRLFLNLETLVSRANVPQEQIPQLVVKELVDNALDTGHSCQFGEIGTNGIYIEDDGPGLPGSDEEIACLFSLDRPLLSSKLVRLPSRGAMGNGLRIVTGAVFASNGSLVVRTRGRSLFLQPLENGQTRITRSTKWIGKGTRVEVQLGTALRIEDDVFIWARTALALAGKGTSYRGKSSPGWYSADAFWDLCQAAENASVRQVLAQMEGCGGAKAGRIVGEFMKRKSASLTKTEATALLEKGAPRASR